LRFQVCKILEFGDSCVTVDTHESIVVGIVLVLVDETTGQPGGESVVTVYSGNFSETTWKNLVATILCEHKRTAVVLVLLCKYVVARGFVSDVTTPSVGVEPVKVYRGLIAEAVEVVL